MCITFRCPLLFFLLCCVCGLSRASFYVTLFLLWCGYLLSRVPLRLCVISPLLAARLLCPFSLFYRVLLVLLSSRAPVYADGCGGWPGSSSCGLAGQACLFLVFSVVWEEKTPGESWTVPSGKERNDTVVLAVVFLFFFFCVCVPSSGGFISVLCLLFMQPSNDEILLQCSQVRALFVLCLCVAFPVFVLVGFARRCAGVRGFTGCSLAGRRFYHLSLCLFMRLLFFLLSPDFAYADGCGGWPVSSPCGLAGRLAVPLLPLSFSFFFLFGQKRNRVGCGRKSPPQKPGEITQLY